MFNIFFQIEKIMSSIGEGIDFSQEQQRMSGTVLNFIDRCEFCLRQPFLLMSAFKRKKKPMQ